MADIWTAMVTVSAANKGAKLLRESTVSIDRDFARFGNKSYAINKINSVEVRQRHPHSQNASFGWGLLSILTALIFLGGLSDPAGGALVMTFCLAARFGFLAYRAWMRSKMVESQPFLTTSSREAQAFVSRDAELIARLRNRIELAVAGELA